MENINNLIIDGNLTRDPQLKEVSEGIKVCTFSIAANRYYRVNDEKKEEVSFVDVETWRYEAEECAKKLQKGRGVRVIGRLKQDRWEDSEGNPRSKIKIVAEHVYIKNFPRNQSDEKEKKDDEILVAV